jgi:hypothetical protein
MGGGVKGATAMKERKEAGKPVVLTWAQIAHVAYALGILPPNSGKAEAFKLHERLMASGRVRKIARGRYEVDAQAEITEIDVE